MVIFVTGGTTGIGLAIARRFAKPSGRNVTDDAGRAVMEFLTSSAAAIIQGR